MITREQYIKALELIDQYHRQNEKVFKESRVLVSDWLNEQDKISTRLFNILNATHYYERPFKYMDEITKTGFKKVRNAGQYSWTEFEDLLNN